jgi:predicted PurR-regulated permease PerM
MNGNKVQTALLGIIALVLLGAVMKLAASILLPLAIAVFLSFIVAPLVNLLDRKRVPRVLAIAIVLLIFFGVMFLIFLFLQASINSLIREYPKYAARFVELSEEISFALSERFDVSFDFSEDINWQGALRDYLVAFSGSFMRILTALVLIIIFLIFLLLEKPFFKSKLAAAFSDVLGKRIGRVFEHINYQVTKYINLKFLISLATGVFIYLSLRIIGMDFALVWGVLGFLLNFIPSIGSFVVVVVTISMGVIQFYPNFGPILAVVICMIGVQLVIGNFLDPRLQGRRLNLSPFLILFSLIFWGWIWGPVGMFLAVPIMVVIQIICENIPELYPISVLMGSGHPKKREFEELPQDETEDELEDDEID